MPRRVSSKPLDVSPGSVHQRVLLRRGTPDVLVDDPSKVYDPWSSRVVVLASTVRSSTETSFPADGVRVTLLSTGRDILSTRSFEKPYFLTCGLPLRVDVLPHSSGRTLLHIFWYFPHKKEESQRTFLVQTEDSTARLFLCSSEDPTWTVFPSRCRSGGPLSSDLFDLCWAFC